MTDYNNFKEALETLSYLSDGWDGGIAIAPTTRAIELAHYVLSRAAENFYVIVRIAPNVEGGINIYVTEGQTDLTVIEISAEGVITSSGIL